VIESIDKTLFTLKHGNDFLLVQIYMDAIIFIGSSHVLISSLQRVYKLSKALYGLKQAPRA
jgi:hypothetical protein